jgi:hypothetical protein
MTAFTNLDYNDYTKTLVKLSKQFRYMDLSDRKKSLRLYPELLMHVPNPSEGEQFAAVMMKPSLLQFIKQPSKFIYMVAMALEPTLMCQLAAHQLDSQDEGVFNQQRHDFQTRAAKEFTGNSFNVTRHYATGGYDTVMMELHRRNNQVFDGYFDGAPIATHQDAMQQIHSILTLARNLEGRGQLNIDSVKWLLPSLPVLNHWGVPMVLAALGLHNPAYGKLEEQSGGVLKTFFEFNGTEAYLYWQKQTDDDDTIPDKYWEVMVSRDGWALNFLQGLGREQGKSPSAKLCKIALSNASGVALLFMEGREQTFKKVKLDAVKEGFDLEMRRIAWDLNHGNEAKIERLRKKIIDFLEI